MTIAREDMNFALKVVTGVSLDETTLLLTGIDMRRPVMKGFAEQLRDQMQRLMAKRQQRQRQLSPQDKTVLQDWIDRLDRTDPLLPEDVAQAIRDEINRAPTSEPIPNEVQPSANLRWRPIKPKEGDQNDQGPA